MRKNKISLFLDSGAFSAWSKGVEINLKEYIDFIKKHEQYIEVYANLDVLFDPEATLKNQKIMEEAGLNPLPCFHFEESFDYLQYYIDNYDYIALGGMAGGSITVKQILPHLDKCFEMICNTSNRLPKCKIHGFGLTSLKLMLRYPWYSVDSTSWVMTSRLGSVYVPVYRNGEYIYDENSWKICVSTRSPSKKDVGKHIDSFPQKQKQVILNYFKYKGYKLGKSKFRFEDSQYQLQDNEKWNGPANEDGSREVEIIVKPGLCNDYKQRDELNIIYFLDLEKSMQEWPWSFELKRKKGFDL